MSQCIKKKTTNGTFNGIYKFKCVVRIVVIKWRNLPHTLGMVEYSGKRERGNTKTTEYIIIMKVYVTLKMVFYNKEKVDSLHKIS